jgi:hypothetical protein
MRRRRSQEEFSWVVEQGEAPVSLDPLDRPTDPPVLRLVSSEAHADEQRLEPRTRTQLGGVRIGPPSRSSRFPTGRRPQIALAAACVIAFVIGWSLGGGVPADAQPATSPAGELRSRVESSKVLLAVASQVSEGAVT